MWNLGGKAPFPSNKTAIKQHLNGEKLVVLYEFITNALTAEQLGHPAARHKTFVLPSAVNYSVWHYIRTLTVRSYSEPVWPSVKALGW